MKHNKSRKAYTIMDLLRQYGALNTALLRIPAYLLSFYTPKFLASSKANDMPLASKKRGKKSQSKPRPDISRLT